MTFSLFSLAIAKGKFQLASLQLFNWLINKYTVDQNIVIVKTVKEEISSFTGLSMKTIPHALKELTESPETTPQEYSDFFNKGAVLLKVGHATYRINPLYCFKGSLEDRATQMKAVFELVYNEACDLIIDK
jgi:S-methylmethionine-dependent homocysteine/selenocysteine methylase